MISINQNDARALQQVAAFFNFISNPEQYKAAVADIKETLTQMQKVTSLYSSVEDFNTKSAKALAEFNSKEAASAESKSKSLADLKKKSDTLADREAKLNAFEQALNSRDVELKAAWSTFEADRKELNASQAKLNADFDTYNGRNITLTQSENEVKALRDKLNAALGAV